jgi:DNA polymerase IIIc chi subunit
MISFYICSDWFISLQSLLQKCVLTKNSASVLFASEEEAINCSKELWKAYNTIPHAVIGDDFKDENLIYLSDKICEDKQNLIITPNVQFEKMIKNNFDFSKFEKIMAIGPDYFQIEGAIYWKKDAQKWVKL